MAGTGNANAPTTKGTRRTRAQAEAGPEPESEVEAETAQKTPQVTRFEKHKGNYQPSTLPRRNAPAPPRGDSPESISTDFFEHSTYDETMGFSPEKRPASPPREFSPAKRRSSEKPRGMCLIT